MAAGKSSKVCKTSTQIGCPHCIAFMDLYELSPYVLPVRLDDPQLRRRAYLSTVRADFTRKYERLDQVRYSRTAERVQRLITYIESAQKSHITFNEAQSTYKRAYGRITSNSLKVPINCREFSATVKRSMTKIEPDSASIALYQDPYSSVATVSYQGIQPQTQTCDTKHSDSYDPFRINTERPMYDRVTMKTEAIQKHVPKKVYHVPNRGLTTETQDSFSPCAWHCDLSIEYPAAVLHSTSLKPISYGTEYTHVNTGLPIRAVVDQNRARKCIELY